MQGVLSEIDGTPKLIDRLKDCSMQIAVHNYLPGVDVWQAFDVDLSIPYVVPKTQVLKLISANLLPREMRVRFKYKHGNLFFYLCPDNELIKRFTSTTVSIVYDNRKKSCLWVSAGEFTFPNSFFFFSRLDGVETTISKLLATKTSELITSFSVLSSENEDLMDIPL